MRHQGTSGNTHRCQSVTHKELEMKAVFVVFLLFGAQSHSDSNFMTKFVSKLRKTIALNSDESSDESESNAHHSDEAMFELTTNVQQVTTNKFLPLGCHNGQTFCENPAGYPSLKYLRKLVSNFTEAEQLILFTNNLRNNMESTSQTLDFSVPKNKKTKTNPAVQSSEDHDWYQDTPLCDTRSSYVYPKAALNQNLQWRYIFNLGNSSSTTHHTDYVQVVKVETCLAEGEQCNIVSYQQTTVCRQRFVHHRLVALDQDGSKYIDTFKFPSCCVCHKIDGATFGKFKL